MSLISKALSPDGIFGMDKLRFVETLYG